MLLTRSRLFARCLLVGVLFGVGVPAGAAANERTSQLTVSVTVRPTCSLGATLLSAIARKSVTDFEAVADKQCPSIRSARIELSQPSRASHAGTLVDADETRVTIQF